MSSVGERERYHHGNLAVAAVDAALALVEGETDGRFSLRAVAEQVGVAHRAVAAHFKDRAGLEAAVAARGFQWLCDHLQSGSDQVQFIAAYAEFALQRPALYDLMMRQGYGAFEQHAALRLAADRVIALALDRLAPDNEDATVRRRAVMRLWMLTHGGVTLHRSGVLRGRDKAQFIAELLAIAGLAASEPDTPQELWNELKEHVDDQ